MDPGAPGPLVTVGPGAGPMGQTGEVIGIIIFAVMAVIVVAAFAVQISRRKAYERGEYDPDDV